MSEISKKNRNPIYGKVIHKGILLKSDSLIVAASRSYGDKLIFNTFNQKNIFLKKIPFIRGIVDLIVDILILHKVSKWLSDKKTKTANSNNQVSTIINFILNNLLYIFLLIIFISIPYLIAEKIVAIINSPHLFNLLSGVLRILSLISYISMISFSPDVKKLYRLHGAEHKAVNSYNKRKTIENSSISHLECSSNSTIFYLLFSIFFYTIFDLFFYTSPPDNNLFNHIIIHLSLLPFLFAIGSEIWLIILNYFPRLITIISQIPGFNLQKRVTIEPNIEEIELADKALKYLQSQQKIY